MDSGSTRCPWKGGRPLLNFDPVCPTSVETYHAYYTKGDHPRIRVREGEIERQVVALFDKMRIEDEKVRHWIVKVLRAKTHESHKERETRRTEVERQLKAIRQRKDRLLDLRIWGEIDAETLATKQTELRDEEDRAKLQLEAASRQDSEYGDLAVKVFELSQALKEKWDTADIPEKRQILELVSLNCTLDGKNLAPTMRKPFDILVKGLISKDGSGGRI